MSKTVARMLSASALASTIVIVAIAQARPATGNDPRVGLKAGYSDAGQAASNMRLIASVPKPSGFFDPGAPAGTPTPPERPDEDNAPPKPAPAQQEGKAPAPPSGLDFANSDLAFQGTRLFVGNFDGFNAYDIASMPRLVASVLCPGGQGDMSVYGHLLFMSVEQTRGRIDCGTQGVQATVSNERFRGVRVFDITDLSNPKQLAAVQTCRGSHTHTLVVDPKDKANVYIYGSGTSSVRSAEELAGCSGVDPSEDPNTSLFSIDVIQVPLASPDQARIVNRPRIFTDTSTGSVAGLWPGGDHGPGTQKTSKTNQCHDITVFPELHLAAGACSGNGILLDITDPVHPVRLDQVIDKNFAYWHSATFNNDGTKVVFTDEWGGGLRPRCRAADPPTWGADAIFDIVDRKLRFASYYKMPAAQTDQENCVAHNGSIVPVPGRDIMVQGWYQGGVSVFDFTDSSKPIEIAYFDRGPLSATDLITGGFWSAYWYNGRIYASEIARGLDVFTLRPSEHLTQNEIDAASLVRLEEFNPQQQPRITWPSNATVARAYLDQLTRSKGLQARRAAEVKASLEAVDKPRPAAAAIDRLNGLAAQLTQDAAAASGADAVRLRALAATLKQAAVSMRTAGSR